MSNISPRVDLAFKKIFGVEENKDLLISLINSIVAEEDQVTDITLLNPYTVGNLTVDKKSSILDVKAVNQEGKRFNIEVQISHEADYDKRALYYWGRLYTEQLKQGEDYEKLAKAIGIHILNFVAISHTDDYHNVFRITAKKHGFEFFKDLELHTIELKKFSPKRNEDLAELISKVKTALDVWVAFLTRHDLLKLDQLPEHLTKHSSLKKAMNVLDMMHFTVQEEEEYEAHLKWLRLEASVAKKSKAEGRAEGIEVGKAEGIKAGKAEGIEVGKSAAIMEVALNLLRQDVSLELIAATTGLSHAELIKMQEDLLKH